MNTANPEPVYGSGIDAAVYAAAGAEDLLAERQKIGTIAVGEASATPGFGLPAKYIIHTVGPEWLDGNHGEREAVRRCYENSLKLAVELQCERVAFPLITAGVNGFPKAEALQIALSVFRDFLSGTDMQIILVVFDGETFLLSGEIFSGMEAFIDAHYVEERLPEEYGFAASRANMLKPDERREKERKSARQTAAPGKKKTPPAGPLKWLGRQAEEVAADAMAGLSPAPATAPTDKPARSLDELIRQVSETWQESLLRLIDEKGFRDTEVYKRANIDRKLFSKIRSNPAYQPKKITAVAFALALRLSLDETKDLLARAGYALSPSSKFDLIVEYFIDQKIYDTYTINLALFQHNQPLLGA